MEKYKIELKVKDSKANFLVNRSKVRKVKYFKFNPENSSVKV